MTDPARPWPPQPGLVTFPGGRVIRGRGLRHALPRGPVPEFGVYVTGVPPRDLPWPHRFVRWPDFLLPASTADALDALEEAWTRAPTERVEIACRGGVGRTGTALAALAVRAGIPPPDAVRWVRARYRTRAVEMPWQRRWVARLEPRDPRGW